MLAERRSVADLLDGIGSRGTPKVEGVSRRLFTSAEYHAMTEAGILSEDERVELIAGEIVRMAPIGSRHAGCVKRLNRRLSRLGDRALVSVQDPVALGLSDVFPLPEPPKRTARRNISGLSDTSVPPSVDPSRPVLPPPLPSP